MDIRSISKGFSSPGGFLDVFRDFSITFPDNRITALLGPSGCGKTTLLNCIAGFFPLDGGRIEGLERDTSISYLFQEPRLLPWRTVKQNIEIVLSEVIPDAERRRRRVNHFLELVELQDAAALYPRELSGGMRQRVSIARAFAYPSEILLMDEPFQALDLDLRTSLVRAFIRLWNEDRRTTVFVTHDIQEALLTADTICILSKRPSRLLYTHSIDIPKMERELADDRLTALEQTIVRRLLNTA